MVVLEPYAPFFRVIRVNAQVGDEDNGVCYAEDAALVGWVTGAV
jgi:hypothetical protein